jgi:hypothetical protein
MLPRPEILEGANSLQTEHAPDLLEGRPPIYSRAGPRFARGQAPDLLEGRLLPPRRREHGEKNRLCALGVSAVSSTRRFEAQLC